MRKQVLADNSNHAPEIAGYTDYEKPFPWLIVVGLLIAGGAGAAVYYTGSKNSDAAPITTYDNNDGYGENYYNYAHEPVVEDTRINTLVPPTENKPVSQPQSEQEEKPFVFFQRGGGKGSTNEAQQSNAPQSSTDKVLEYLNQNGLGTTANQVVEEVANVAREVSGSLERKSAGLSSNFKRVYPYKEANLSNVILAGHTISAVLDVAINSSLPGLVKAWTTDNTFSTDGERLLIPK